MNRNTFSILVFVAAIVFALAQSLSQRDSPPAPVPGPETGAKPELSTTRFMVPGPEGAPVEAEFYGLEAMPPFGGDDVCAVLSARLDAIKQYESAKAVFRVEEPLSRFCPELAASGGVQDGIEVFSPLGMLDVLDELDQKGGHDIAFSAMLERTIVDRLKSANSAADVEIAIKAGYGIDNLDDTERLHFTRFFADLTRLDGKMCHGPAAKICQVSKWIHVATAYADVGSLVSDDRHFRDAETLLTESETQVRTLANVDMRINWLKEIASGFGYAGEAGRDGKLTGRAVALSRSIVEELQQLKTGNEDQVLKSALAGLAANLGRHASFASDKKQVFEEAVKVGDQSIALQERFDPGSHSWTLHANRAADRVQLYSYSRDLADLDKAVADGEIALEASGGDADSESGAHTMYRLGEALAWRSAYAPAEAQAQKAADARKALSLLAEARSFYERTGSAAYLRYIGQAEALLKPKPEEPGIAKNANDQN